MTFEDGYAALECIIERNPQAGFEGRNEAQTRFDLIDDVLKEVLEWPRDCITVESCVEGGYSDYELHDRGVIAVVEAKREGVSFVLPTSTKSGLCRIAPILSDKANASLRAAMVQAINYSSLRGVSPTIVTNGHQWVIFLGSRQDRIPPLEGRALIFPSLVSMKDNFATLYEAAAWPHIKTAKLASLLSDAPEPPPPALSNALSRYPGSRLRNSLQTNLQILGELLLQDLPSEEQYSNQFMAECYASSGALSSYSNMSKELLKSRSAEILPEMGAIEQPATTKSGINPALSEEGVSAAASHRPIVLLGGVGVGKSTFLQHLVKVDARSIFEDAIAITVDYGQGATFSSPSEYAIEQIRNDLYEKYNIDIEDADFVEDLYRADLKRFDRSIDGLSLKDEDPTEYSKRRRIFLRERVENRSDHLKRSIERIIRTRRRQVVVFLDNVDQRDHEDQNEVFLTANELAASWAATVFVTLRPETYYESSRYGAISGYHPRVFSIAPPRTDVMLKKRIEFALKVLETGGEARAPRGGFSFESENLELFLRALHRNVQDNRQLMELIDNLAGGNMRRALGFVTQFIGSGHVDTGKIIAIERDSPGSYRIPVHEFLRAIMYGDNEYYNPASSPVANVFILDRPQFRCHFLIPIILDFISRHGAVKGSSGYVASEQLYNYLQRLGYEVGECDFALNSMARYRLIEAPLSNFDAKQTDRARITTVGNYTLTNLIAMFTYLDAVVVATPILSLEAKSKIDVVYTIADRLNRVETFRAYLDDAWNAAALDGAEWAWTATSGKLQQDVDRVRSRVSP
ncbi:hypothetical protein V3N95_08750 [Micrococcaceae bacterium Sec6.3]